MYSPYLQKGTDFFYIQQNLCYGEISISITGPGFGQEFCVAVSHLHVSFVSLLFMLCSWESQASSPLQE